jgi:hypothetical protein
MNFCDYGAIQEGEETPYFCFTDHAQHTFFVWLTELEREKLNAEEEPILLEHFAKYRKLVPSLALIFHLINVASGKARGPISVDCVERAAAWYEYLEGHGSPDLRDGPQSWISSRKEPCETNSGERLKQFVRCERCLQKGMGLPKNQRRGGGGL